MEEGKQRAIVHLEKLRDDARDEIKRRIEQRDKYSIQLTIALGAIVAVAFSKNLDKALLAAPLVSIYFTVLILYSYRVHRILARYLRDEIEPELADFYGVPKIKEWETYYQNKDNSHKHKVVPGIRLSFFILMLWIVCLGSPSYILIRQWDQDGWKDKIIVFVFAVAYLVAAVCITKKFWRKKE